MKAKEEDKDFYEVLDYYLDLTRKLHKRTLNYLGEFPASISPLHFMEGGLYGGTLKANEKIYDVLRKGTFSFGVTALNELQRLYNGKSITEDGEFALEVMDYIDKKLSEYKKKDGLLYSVYGTPAESLSGTQVKQFRKKYGIIKNVSDKDYFTNSFHCHVSEDISPIEKQDKEKRFWKYFPGGRIQYNRFYNSYNTQAIKDVVRRGMDMGFYEGVNLQLNTCDDCGHQFTDADECPVCGSKNIIRLERVCGYLGYSKIHGESRMNDSKMAEIHDRKSM